MRMFKRADSKNETEVKKQDVKGRKRKIIFNMRVTEDERDQINQRAALSGLLKQEFCIQSTNASESCLLWKYTLNK